MNNELNRLIYISTNEIQGDQDSVNGEISRILDVARFKNTKLEITGALMFSLGCFAQVLEGNREPVQQIFKRIE